MKTRNVYFGKIYEVASIEDAYFKTNINFIYRKDTMMVLKRNILGKRYMKDLNDGQKYSVKIPNRVGKLYVSRRYLESFNDITHNTMDNLPKKKILSLGSKYTKNKEM